MKGHRRVHLSPGSSLPVWLLWCPTQSFLGIGNPQSPFILFLFPLQQASTAPPGSFLPGWPAPPPEPSLDSLEDTLPPAPSKNRTAAYFRACIRGQDARYHPGPSRASFTLAMVSTNAWPSQTPFPADFNLWRQDGLGTLVS